MSKEQKAQISVETVHDTDHAHLITKPQGSPERVNPMYDFETTADVLLMTGQAKPLEESAAHASEEESLISAVIEGNRDLFGTLYDRYAPMVHGILLARVPPVEVDDLVQDIFLHALKKLTTLRNRSSFGPWIAMIARNRAMDFHRRSRPTEEVTEELRSTEDPPPEAVEILAHIRALPEAYRETLVLRLVEGMTGPEIALRTGLTPPSVRVNLHRGMKLLRTKLGIKENTNE
jgi:RNA polymerase sigma-70 factor, ECF subfamily